MNKPKPGGWDVQPRYDEERGIYRDCKFCGGKGCLACPGEAEKEYKRQFPNGPEPIATFKIDNLEDMKKMKEVFGPDSLTHAFGPKGGGMEEIMEKLDKETLCSEQKSNT